jgi:hypothetical protein
VKNIFKLIKMKNEQELKEIVKDKYSRIAEHGKGHQGSPR